jgi:hypothetical protein
MTDPERRENKPPETRPSTFCIAAILMDQSFSGTRIEAVFSISRISSFSEYTLIGSMGFSVTSPSAAKKLHSISQCHQSNTHANYYRFFNKNKNVALHHLLRKENFSFFYK